MITVEKIISWKIIITLKRLSFVDFLKLYRQIKEIINQGKEVPLALVKEFVNSIEIDDSDLISRGNRENLIKNCYEYLSSCGYDFSFPSEYSGIIWPIIGQKNLDYNLHQMITEAVDFILRISPVDWIRLKKSDLVKILYNEINIFNQNNLHNKLTPYSTLVITGYISANFGLINSYETYTSHNKKKKGKGYNKFLKDEVRNKLNAK
jgi:hypothetical protein